MAENEKTMNPGRNQSLSYPPRRGAVRPASVRIPRVNSKDAALRPKETRAAGDGR